MRINIVEQMSSVAVTSPGSGYKSGSGELRLRSHASRERPRAATFSRLDTHTNRHLSERRLVLDVGLVPPLNICSYDAVWLSGSIFSC